MPTFLPLYVALFHYLLACASSLGGASQRDSLPAKDAIAVISSSVRNCCMLGVMDSGLPAI